MVIEVTGSNFLSTDVEKKGEPARPYFELAPLSETRVPEAVYQAGEMSNIPARFTLANERTSPARFFSNVR